MIKKHKEHGGIKYILSLPNNYRTDIKYPLLIFLHGAGTRGNNTEELLKNPFFTETGDNIADFIVAAPQCHADSWFDIFEQLYDFIVYVINDYNVDRDRCCLIGASMGGYAVWQEAMSHPELYAAIVPICGGGMYWNAGRLKNIKIHAFHGSEDKTVFPEESEKMVDAVNRCGGCAKLTVYDGTGHDSWNRVYQDKKLFEWLKNQKKINANICEDKLNNSKQFG